MEEFVYFWIDTEPLIPISDVVEVTGLTPDEIRSVCDTIWLDETETGYQVIKKK